MQPPTIHSLRSRTSLSLSLLLSLPAVHRRISNKAQNIAPAASTICTTVLVMGILLVDVHNCLW